MNLRKWMALFLAAALLTGPARALEPAQEAPEDPAVSYTDAALLADGEDPEAEEDPETAEAPETGEAPETAEAETDEAQAESDPENAEAEEMPEVSQEPETFDPPLSNDLQKNHDAYMSGYSDGTFRPGASMTRAEAYAVVYKLLKDQRGSTKLPYGDVPANAWYFPATAALYARGLLPQTGSLGPQEPMTRGELIALLAGLLGTDDSAECQFPDVDPSDALYPAVATAESRGWIQGGDGGTFDGDQAVTRAQAAEIFNRVQGRKADPDLLARATDLPEFLDVPKTAWYYAAVTEATVTHAAEMNKDGTESWFSYTAAYTVTLRYSGRSVSQRVLPGESAKNVPAQDDSGRTITHWVTETGEIGDPANAPASKSVAYTAMYAPSLTTEHLQYVQGSRGSFRPDGSVSRAEAVQMLYSLLSDKSKGGFPSRFEDVAADAWYGTPVSTLASLGLLDTTGGSFRPNEAMTRGEFVELITRLVPYVSQASKFSDVTAEDACYSAVVTAVSKGWINGYQDGTFRADDSLTRAQAVAVLNRMTGRTGDAATIGQMDSRYTYSDVPKTHWAYTAIMEASVTHTHTGSGSGESWKEYHKNAEADWSSSESVCNAAVIINTVSNTYQGNYTHSYNYDYSDGRKEQYVNNNGYSSGTGYLLWISLHNQKVYLFTGSQGNWKAYKTFICGTGAPGTPTPVGVTYTTYKSAGWYNAGYSCYPVVGFYPGTGYAFHSRLYYPSPYESSLLDSSIGWPVSHGCIRMLDADIRYLYNNIPLGTTVVVY